MCSLDEKIIPFLLFSKRTLILVKKNYQAIKTEIFFYAES